MSSTTVLAPREVAGRAVEPVAGVGPASEVEVLGLDPVATLGFVVERRRRQDVAAAEELRAVTHWADLHRVGPADGVGAVDPEIATAVTRRARSLGVPGVWGVEGELRLAGQGAFAVAEFAVADLAAALGMSEAAGRAYVGQAVELRDRLPLCWDRVMTGDLPAWKARQVADQTIPLTADAAGWVDAHLAAYAHRLSLGRILRAVDAAVLRFDPEEAARRAAAAAEHRGVWLEEHLDGTTTLTAVTDTPDAVAFDATVDTVATGLGRLGDPDPHRVRRAKALGVLADPQYALTLTTPDPTDGELPAGSPAGRPTPTMHVHLHLDALTSALTAEPDRAADRAADRVADRAAGGVAGAGLVARVTGGPAPGARVVPVVERWITGLRPGAVVKLTPVVDLTTHLAVDAYEVPDRLRTQIEHRDLTCRFPWCPRTGTLDIDHIEPYQFHDSQDPVDPEDPGRPPPGQTATSNLARLCRFHHRVKTHGSWTYQLTHDTVCTWTSPLGHRYSVDENGTRPLP
jgi:Domain of unknown function (DUF222)